MNYRIRRGFEIAERDLTPESVYFSRRRVLQGLGLTAGALLAGCDPRQLPTALRRHLGQDQRLPHPHPALGSLPEQGNVS